MRRTSLRIIAAVALAGWVAPLGLPLVCSVGLPVESVPCEQPAVPAHTGSTLSAGPQVLPCSNPALCGVPVTAMPTARVVAVTVADLEGAVGFHLSKPLLGERPAPLSPPPQA